MKIKTDFILREVAGEFIVVPVGRNALENNSIMIMTESGAAIWRCLEEDWSYEAIVAYMLDQYDVDEELARADLDEFLDRLREADLLEA